MEFEETIIVISTAAFWFYVLLAISTKLQKLEKEKKDLIYRNEYLEEENKELKASIDELLEANFKLTEKCEK